MAVGQLVMLKNEPVLHDTDTPESLLLAHKFALGMKQDAEAKGRERDINTWSRQVSYIKAKALLLGFEVPE